MTSPKLKPKPTVNLGCVCSLSEVRSLHASTNTHTHIHLNVTSLPRVDLNFLTHFTGKSGPSIFNGRHLTCEVRTGMYAILTKSGLSFIYKMIRETISMLRVDSDYPHNFKVNSYIFKDGESETEAKTNSWDWVCRLLACLVSTHIHTHNHTHIDQTKNHTDLDFAVTCCGKMWYDFLSRSLKFYCMEKLCSVNCCIFNITCFTLCTINCVIYHM